MSYELNGGGHGINDPPSPFASHGDGECCVVLSLSSRRYEDIPTLAFYFPENTLGGERIEIS